MNRKLVDKFIVFIILGTLLIMPSASAAVNISPWQQLLAPAVQASASIRDAKLNSIYANAIYSEQDKEITESEKQKTKYNTLIAKLTATTTAAIDFTSTSAIILAAEAAVAAGTFSPAEFTQLTELAPTYSNLQLRFMIDYQNFATYLDYANQAKNLLIAKEKAENDLALTVAANHLAYNDALDQLDLANEQLALAEAEDRAVTLQLRLGTASLHAWEEDKQSLNSARFEVMAKKAKVTSASLKLKNALGREPSSDSPDLPTTLTPAIKAAFMPARSLTSFLQLLYTNHPDIKQLNNLIQTEKERQFYIDDYFTNTSVDTTELPYYKVSKNMKEQYEQKLRLLKEALKNQVVSLYQNSEETLASLKEQTLSKKNQELSLAKMTVLYKLGSVSNWQIQNLQGQLRISDLGQKLTENVYISLELQLESLCGTFTYKELIK